MTNRSNPNHIPSPDKVSVLTEVIVDAFIHLREILYSSAPNSRDLSAIAIIRSEAPGCTCSYFSKSSAGGSGALSEDVIFRRSILAEVFNEPLAVHLEKSNSEFLVYHWTALSVLNCLQVIPSGYLCKFISDLPVAFLIAEPTRSRASYK